MLVKRHDFNSDWWREDVGIVTDYAFFDLTPEEQKEALSPYAWVEYRAIYDPLLPLGKICGAGFFQTDVQIRYRQNLSLIQHTGDLDNITIRFADEYPFTIDAGDMRDFNHERYMTLPGITPLKLNERYALWSNRIIAENPDRCIQVESDSTVQGWFISQLSPDGLHLTLAMLHKQAMIRGKHLYAKALLAYKEKGDQTGSSSFSVTNPAVLNIFSKFGARFDIPELFWLRIMKPY
ncbi:hypothetical protein ACFL30_03250 [Candidatus Latescibacterota bacterium]